MEALKIMAPEVEGFSAEMVPLYLALLADP